MLWCVECYFGEQQAAVAAYACDGPSSNVNVYAFGLTQRVTISAGPWQGPQSCRVGAESTSGMGVAWRWDSSEVREAAMLVYLWARPTRL